MRYGMIRDETASEYHQSGAIGHSMLCDYLKSPSGYHDRYVLKKDSCQREQSAAMGLGSMVHLCNELYGQELDIIAEDDMTKAGGIRVSSQCKYGPNAVTPAAVRLWKQILTNSCARDLIHNRQGAEVTYRVQDESGLSIQARPDGYHTDYLYDVKTTSSDLKWFESEAKKWGYDVEAGLYLRLHHAIHDEELVPEHEFVPFFFIVVMAVWPYDVRVYRAPYSMICDGLYKADKAIDGIASENWGEDQTEPEVMSWR